MNDDTKTNTIIATIQSWLDYQERDGAYLSDDTNLMRVPYWPSRGQLKAWIEHLQALLALEQAAYIRGYSEGISDMATIALQALSDTLKAGFAPDTAALLTARFTTHMNDRKRSFEIGKQAEEVL